jgi:SAM-dependent methyltransferase
MVHYGKCPLCNSETLVQHARCSDHFLTREEFELNRCAICGLVFTQNSPDGKEIGKYYASDDYVSHNDSACGFSNVLYRFSRTIMLAKKRRLVMKYAGLKTGNLLDIGSGTGYFLSVMKNAGWNVLGIEINNKAREFSTARFGLEILEPGNINTLEPGGFDCITLWHVLEHLQDPAAYSSEIMRLLKPGGKCIVALPNCRSYDAEYYGSHWAAYDVPRHLWHFTPDAFRRFAGKAGFELTGIRTLPLDVFYISVLSEKYKGSKMHFIRGILKALWFSIPALFNKHRSSSLIYLLRKSY